MAFLFRRLSTLAALVAVLASVSHAAVASDLFTVGSTVAGLTPDSGLVLRNGSDLMPVNSAGTYTFPTALPSGASYNVTVAQIPGNPVQYCTVTGGSGTISNANVTSPRITCAVRYARFAYASAGLDSNISMYGVSAAGQWRHRGYVTTPDFVGAVALHPSQQWLYAVRDPDVITSYQIDGSTGQLTTIASASTGPGPHLIQFDPQGRFAFVVSSTLVNTPANTPLAASDSMHSYSINPRSGALTPTGSITVPTNIGELGKLAVDPSGHYLYGVFLSNFEGHGSPTSTIAAWSIDQSTGALTGIQPTLLPDGFVPDDIQFDPAGRFVYILTRKTSAVLTCKVDTSSGQLHEVSTFTNFTPFTTVSGYVPTFVDSNVVPMAIAIDPASKFAYVLVASNTGDGGQPYANQITAFAIAADSGALSPVGVSTIESAAAMTSMRVDPSGDYLDVASSINMSQTSTFPINRGTGALTGTVNSLGFLVPSSSTEQPFSTQTSAVSRSSSPASPAARFAFVTNAQSNSLSEYTIDASTGALTLQDTIAIGAPPGLMAVDPIGKVAYVSSLDTSGTLTEYAIDSNNGVLSLLGTATGQAAPAALVVDPSGRFAYTAAGTEVRAFNGVTQVAAVSTGDTSGSITSLAMDPTGSWLYASNQAAQSISVFLIDPATGNIFLRVDESKPKPVVSLSTAERPYFLTFEPGGRYAYSLDSTVAPSSVVTTYAFVNGTFTITPVNAPVGAAGLENLTMAFEPSGRFAYAVSLASQEISIFAVDQFSGALSLQGQVSTGAASQSLSIDPSGKYLYLTSEETNSLLSFRINPNTGALTRGSSIATGAFPFSVVTTGITP